MADPQLVEQALARAEADGCAWILVPIEDAKPGEPTTRRALTITGLARILEVEPGSIVQFRAASKAGRMPVGTPPFPAQDGRHSRSYYWWPERAGEILDWQAARPGRGAGGGAGAHRARRTDVRPKKVAAKKLPEPPAYRRIADDIAAQITDGRLAPGDQLPSITDLATQAGVSRMPVVQALTLLRGQGLIVSRHIARGRANFVAEPPPPAKE